MPREITENNRLEGDSELEWEVDHAGVIHLRKTQSKTVFLEGYGTEDFGISPYQTKRLITTGRILVTTGLVAAGLIGWRFSETLYIYTLIFRESLRQSA